MACRVRCEAAPIVAGGTTCIDVSGTGVTGDPLQISEVIPAGIVVPHPLAPFLPDTENGLRCTPTGLMAPQPGYPGVTSGDVAAGSLPDIIADTVPVPWGPIFTSMMTNFNIDRLLFALHAVVQPLVFMTLEPGARATFGIILDPAGLAVYLPTWRMSNFSGAAVETYAMFPQTGVNVSGITLPGGVQTVEYQSWIETSGFTGPSSVVTLLQAGLGIRQWGMPL